MSCRRHSYSFDAATVLFHYIGPIKILLSAYKGSGRRSIAIFIAEEMYKALKDVNEPFILVPVPARPYKILRQGWDQTQLIVQLLHARYRLPTCSLLRRLRGGRQQKKLSAEDRILNMRKRFVLRKAVPANTVLILVDDILTTGATISACAEALKQGGALRVQACLFAAD
ncbi:MAG: hypothetical protein KKC64_07060 [Spirochaetes bacterium]|nr:hypothetical protein [Spirochaetota bacterium]